MHGGKMSPVTMMISAMTGFQQFRMLFGFIRVCIVTVFVVRCRMGVIIRVFFVFAYNERVGVIDNLVIKFGIDVGND